MTLEMRCLRLHEENSCRNASSSFLGLLLKPKPAVGGPWLILAVNRQFPASTPPPPTGGSFSPLPKAARSIFKVMTYMTLNFFSSLMSSSFYTSGPVLQGVTWLKGNGALNSFSSARYFTQLPNHLATNGWPQAACCRPRIHPWDHGGCRHPSPTFGRYQRTGR
jgi:hypothetical protein